MSEPLQSASELIEAIRAGRMVVLVDDEDRENEGDLVMAADAVTPEAINFMARFGRGLICLTLTEARCRQLQLPMMVHDNRSAHATAFTVSIEAAQGVTTGISAGDRAATILAAVSPQARPEDLVQPGHIFPLMAQLGGVLVRAGHTEAGCDLAQLAGHSPAGVICEILNDDGSMARLPDLRVFAKTHGLPLGSIADLIHHRTSHESLVERVTEQTIEHAGTVWRLISYRDRAMGQPHLALVKGEPSPEQPCLARVHEPFTVLDFFEYSGRHSWPLGQALAYIASEPEPGVVVLLNCAVGASRLFEQLQHTEPVSGASSTLRNYGMGAAILRDLGVGQMLVLGQPRKMPSMAGFGLEVVGYRQPTITQGHAR